MRALITGGAGFIGSHLAEELLMRGYEVEVIDDLSTGSANNIGGSINHPRFYFTVSDVRHETLLAMAVDRADIIFHLAAAVGVKLIVDSPVRTIETNVNLTELVLKYAAKKQKRVVFTSTSEVYGKRTKMPFKETDDLIIGEPQKGRWSYACSKLLDEFLVLAYCHEKKLPAIIVRLFNTIGPRQTGRYGMVVPSFISRAKRGMELEVYGDGRQKRCFGWVKDVVWALAQLSEYPPAYGQVFNIGGTEEVTILELAKRVNEIVGSKGGIVTVPYNIAYTDGFEDMRRRVPDLAKIRAAIQYRSLLSLNDMIREIARETK